MPSGLRILVRPLVLAVEVVAAWAEEEDLAGVEAEEVRGWELDDDLEG